MLPFVLLFTFYNIISCISDNAKIGVINRIHDAVIWPNNVQVLESLNKELKHPIVDFFYESCVLLHNDVPTAIGKYDVALRSFYFEPNRIVKVKVDNIVVNNNIVVATYGLDYETYDLTGKHKFVHPRMYGNTTYYFNDMGLITYINSKRSHNSDNGHQNEILSPDFQRFLEIHYHNNDDNDKNTNNLSNQITNLIITVIILLCIYVVAPYIMRFIAPPPIPGPAVGVAISPPGT